MVEGLDMPKFSPLLVRQQLGGAATVYSGLQATTLPHLAGEWKGPGKEMVSTQARAGYDDACMVYGTNKARPFLNSPDPANHSYGHTFTTDSRTPNSLAHYSSEPEGQVKYHQYPTASSFLIPGFEDSKRSRRRLGSLQDEAKETSEGELNKWAANRPSPVGPNDRLLAEHDSPLQTPAAGNVNAPPRVVFLNTDKGYFARLPKVPIPSEAPPQPIVDISLLLESSDDDDYQPTERRHKRARRILPAITTKCTEDPQESSGLNLLSTVRY